MLPAVDASLVSLGQPEPPLQLQVVLHLRGHTRTRQTVPPGSPAITAAICTRTASPLRARRRFNLPNCRRLCRTLPFSGSSVAAIRFTSPNVFSDLFLFLGDRLQARSMQLASRRTLPVAAPPFFGLQIGAGWTPAPPGVPQPMRRPGGWSGPPWSSLRMPRTTLQ